VHNSSDQLHHDDDVSCKLTHSCICDKLHCNSVDFVLDGTSTEVSIIRLPKLCDDYCGVMVSTAEGKTKDVIIQYQRGTTTTEFDEFPLPLFQMSVACSNFTRAWDKISQKRLGPSKKIRMPRRTEFQTVQLLVRNARWTATHAH
jgi:hypothetical protein